MTDFANLMLPDALEVPAPDGSTVSILCRLAGGSMARFALPAGRVTRPVRHRTVEEIWYVVSGRGEMWRAHAGRAETTALLPGLSLTIPVGCAFQFRADAETPFAAIAITMPPWPGADEAEFVDGPWTPTVSA